MNLVDVHVLVTGGTAGLGLALARELQAAGARVTVCGRDRGRLDDARRVLGAGANLVACDVGDPGQHAGLIAGATAVHGPVDVLVNNAGVQQLMDFTRDQPPGGIADEIAVNLTAPLLLTAALLPALRRRPGGAVVQITSGLALSPKTSAPVYCGTKAGLRAFTRALRWQLAGEPVRVIEVLPPLVDTAMTAGRGRGKLSPEAAAREIVAGLRRGRAEIYVGKAKLLRVIMAISTRLAAAITRRW